MWASKQASDWASAMCSQQRVRTANLNPTSASCTPRASSPSAPVCRQEQCLQKRLPCLADARLGRGIGSGQCGSTFMLECWLQSGGAGICRSSSPHPLLPGALSCGVCVHNAVCAVDVRPCERMLPRLPTWHCTRKRCLLLPPRSATSKTTACTTSQTRSTPPRARGTSPLTGCRCGPCLTGVGCVCSLCSGRAVVLV